MNLLVNLLYIVNRFTRFVLILERCFSFKVNMVYAFPFASIQTMFWWISRHQSKDMNGLRLGTVLQNRFGCVRSSGCNASYLRYIITFDDLYHHDFYLWDFLSMWETMHALNTLTWGMLVLVYFYHHLWVLHLIFLLSEKQCMHWIFLLEVYWFLVVLSSRCSLAKAFDWQKGIQVLK